MNAVQRAKFEDAERHVIPAAPQAAQSATIAIDALNLAQQAGGTPAEVTARADAYIAWLNGKAAQNG